MTRNASIPAKLIRPAQHGAFRRTGLFAVLDHAGPVVWVSGPPGAGKTTLVASYIEVRRLRPLWYQVDEGDCDVASFFYYLRLAAMRAAPRRRWRLPLLTPEYLAGVPTFSRSWFEELFAGLPRPAVLVLDNYQELTDGSRLHEVLRLALETLPRSCRAMVISRRDPPLPLARMRATGGMTFVESEALRLSLEETSGIARAKIAKRVPAEQARALHAATEGWAAGVVLMLERPAGEGGASAAPSGATPQALFDYFASEIFDRSDAETRRILVETALMGKMTAGQAEALTGSPRAAEILAGLARRRYVTDCHTDPERTYQYHPLFRSFLLARARDDLPPARRSDLRRVAASVLEQSGAVEDAAEILRQAEDWDGLARLAQTHAPGLLAQGRGGTLEGWLKALPPDRLNGEPWLLYWLGACRLPLDPKSSAESVGRAFEGFQAAGDRAGMLAASSIAIEAIFFDWGDFGRLDRWIATLEAMLRPSSERLPEALHAQAIASMFTALLWRQPHHVEMAGWAERAETCFWASRDAEFRSRFGRTLAQSFLWRGDTAKAGSIMESLLTPMAAGDASPLTRLRAMELEAHVAWLAADTPRCLRAVATGLALAASAGIPLMNTLLLMAKVYGQLAAGDLVGARTSLGQIRVALDETQSVMVAQYHYLASWLAILDGNLPATRAHADAALRLTTQAGALFPIICCRHAIAQILFEQGEREAARMHLEDALRQARAMRSPIMEYLCLLVEVDVAFRERDEAAAFPALGRALALGRERGFLMGGWWRPTLVARLCGRALTAGIEVEYARRLVQVHRLLPDPADPAPEAWPWHVRVYALGRFEVQVDEGPVTLAGRAQRKPLALLKALIAFGGHGVSEAELADVLWPDAEADAAHQAFSVTLHRLRRLLRHEDAVRRRDGRLDLDPQYVWVDVFALERVLDQAGAAVPEARAGLTDAALRLYRGPLLEGEEDEPWILEPRARLRARILRRLSEVARTLEAAGDADRAISCYLRALEVDGSAEDLYRRLMSLYRRLGRRAEALALYQRCRATLAATLGVSPSPETEALLRG
jgi:DNA-binding SARP family transcriptional activator